MINSMTHNQSLGIFFNIDIFPTLTLEKWGKVFTIMKHRQYEQLANKMIREVPFNLTDWNQAYYYIERYMKGELRPVDAEAEKICSIFEKWLVENKIPRSDWLGVMNASDAEVRRIAMGTTIAKLIEIDSEKKGNDI